MRKVLVAGATGYLGKYVVREFSKRGFWIRALVRNPQKLGEIGPFLEPAVIDDIKDIFIGQTTEPETLDGLCDDIDIVFSSLGVTRQKDKLSYRDVDYQANKNILNIAVQKSVKKFIYVSVFEGHRYEHLEIVRAHEDFVRELRNSGLDYAVIRPTGYFSDMTEFLKMANSGRIYLIGNGQNRINPVHGADLAEVCVDAVTSTELEIPVGGPVIYSGNEIAALAFSILKKKARITRIPSWIAKSLVTLIRLYNKQTFDLAQFMIAASQNDGVAPATGTHTLDSHYQEIVSKWLERGR